MLAKTESDDDRLPAVLDAFLASDSANEQNLICKGRCHLVKFTHRLTSIDIENMGARNLLDVLASFPGLFLGKDRFLRPQLGIYGLLGQNRILFLIDGVRQNDPFDGSASLSLPADAIDLIDVYFGPGGTWFGEGSLLGVIAVTTKHLPGYRHWSFFSTDLSMGGGLSAAFKGDRIKATLLGSFSAFNQIDKQLSQHQGSNPGNNMESFSLKDLWASGFVDAKISNAAQAHVLLRTTLSTEIYGPSFSALSALDKTFNKREIAWITDLHLIKKRAQKNALDIFFTTGFFRGASGIFATGHSIYDHFHRLTDRYDALHLELGTKFHCKPWPSHDLFFGVGGVLQGITTGTHILSDTDDKSSTESLKESKMDFGGTAWIFGRPSALFDASSGHVYTFIQDEWQIKAPLLVAIGARALLPIEDGDISAELMPNIGAVLTPISKIRFKVAFHTSLRAPTFYERSDRLYDAVAENLGAPFIPKKLAFEKSRTLEASVWYGDISGVTQFKSGLTAHFSKVEDAISSDPKAPLSNRHELYIAGARSINEVNFAQGHRFSLGVFYSIAYRKDFDEKGYPKCRARIFNLVSDQPPCDTDEGVPRLMLRAIMYFDMLSLGSVNLSGSFMGMTKVIQVITEPVSQFDVTYLSKPIWRHLTCFFALKGAIGGLRYETKSPNLTSGHLYPKGFLATIGLNIGL